MRSTIQHKERKCSGCQELDLRVRKTSQELDLRARDTQHVGGLVG